MGQFARQTEVLGQKANSGQFNALCYRTPVLTNKLIITGFSHLVKPFWKVPFYS